MMETRYVNVERTPDQRIQQAKMCISVLSKRFKESDQMVDEYMLSKINDVLDGENGFDYWFAQFEMKRRALEKVVVIEAGKEPNNGENCDD